MADASRQQEGGFRHWWTRVTRAFGRALRDYQWQLIGLLGLVALVLGFVGYERYSDAQGAAWSAWDVLYRDIQLLALEGGNVEGEVPWQLEIARVLAPLAAGFAVLSALLFVFRDQLEAMRLARLKRHVVVCGLGRKGSLAVRSLCDRGDRVVAIEEDPGNPRIEAARECGAFVVSGDARYAGLLHKAGAHRAAQLLVLCGSDATNSEVAVHAREYMAGRSGDVLSCLADIADPGLCTLLRLEELASRRDVPFRLDFFNVTESGALMLLREHPPGDDAVASRGRAPHLTTVGLGPFGERLVVQAALAWRSTLPASDEKPRVTVVDPDASLKTASLCRRFPRLTDVCDVITRDLEVDSEEFRHGSFLLDERGRVDATSVYICLDSDAAGLSAALTLLPHLRDCDVPVVVRTFEIAGLTSLVSNEVQASGQFPNLHVFPLLDRTCSAEALLGGTREAIARAIHDIYVREQAEQGTTPETNPAMVRWEELPESLRESNRDQADHIGVKLRAVGCDLAPLTDWDAESFRFSVAEIERLAEMEHERWVQDRMRSGWTYAPGTKDLDRKTSPHLVPWDELTDDVQEWDRVMVRGIPTFLARAGYQIVRVAKRDGA